MKRVFEVLGMQNEWRGERTSFQIACPICDAAGSRKKHMNVNTSKNLFCCPKCGTGGGYIGFYGFMKYSIDPKELKSNPELSQKLKKEINEALGQHTEYIPYEKESITPIDFEPIILDERDETYNALLRQCELIDAHYNNLVERGLREEDIVRNNYKSIPQAFLDEIPKKLRLEEFCNLQGVPGFYKDDFDNWKLLKRNSGIYIPMRNVSRDFTNQPQGEIQGMQIRYDIVKDGTPRYMWLSTSDMKSGSGAKTWPHFVGYPEKTIYLTEGGLKGDIAHRFSGDPFICIPGVNATKNLEPALNRLKDYGVKHIKTAFDMDFYTNKNVANAFKKLTEMLERLGFTWEMEEWDHNYKGIDDWYLHRYLSSGGKLDEKR